MSAAVCRKDCCFYICVSAKSALLHKHFQLITFKERFTPSLVLFCQDETILEGVEVALSSRSLRGTLCRIISDLLKRAHGSLGAMLQICALGPGASSYTSALL